jgi:hypothetical protein
MELTLISTQWQLLLFLPFIAVFPLALRWKALRHGIQSRLTDWLSWIINVR